MTQIISALFIIIITGFLLISFLRDKNYRNECVSVGILGTFVGITLSLYNFDSSNISSSIPGFLDGLKLAFITSASGVCASILLSLRKPDSEVNSLEELVELQKANNDILSASLSTLSEQSSEQIVKALKDVVTEFNHHIETQFGDNFKELSQAFHKLVAWQEEYTIMVQQQQQSIHQQHALTMQRLNDFEKIENTKLNALKIQGDEFICLLNAHAGELKNQTDGIYSLISSFKGQSSEITNSLSASLRTVNMRISDSVKLAEDNITALIGVANGKLR
jgi:hypothetical protein